MDVTKVLDCKGLSCPEPILNMKMAMRDLNTGDIVEMTATDPGSVQDMKSWSKRTGHEILEEKQDGDVYTYYVKKK